MDVVTSPAVYDHLRPTDGDHPAGTYRVVGTGAETVTLLRVADADGRRVSTGEVVTVGADELTAFAPAENPDGNRPLAAALASKPETIYWSVRVFVRQLLAHPLPAAVAIALLVAGSYGDRFFPLPDVVFSGLVIAGGLGLAYVGSGRL